MPRGFPRGEYDTLCPKKWMRQYSRALRAFTVPVSVELRPLRGIQVASPGAGNPAACLACCDEDRFDAQELGLPTSVLALYYFSIENAGANTSGVPSPMILEFRQGAACVTTVRFHGNWTPQTFTETDLLIQLKGLLGVQWEIWGRIEQGGFPVRVSLAACLSEHDDKVPAAFPGPNLVAAP